MEELHYMALYNWLCQKNVKEMYIFRDLLTLTHSYKDLHASYLYYFLFCSFVSRCFLYRNLFWGAPLKVKLILFNCIFSIAPDQKKVM